MKKSLLLFLTSIVLVAFTHGKDSVFKSGVAGEGKKTVVYRWAEVGEGKRPSLVLFLHGMGERGRDNQSHMRHGIPKLVKWLKKEKKHCIVLVPQCPGDAVWASGSGGHKNADSYTISKKASYPMQLVFDLLDSVVKKHNVDKSRIYITGLSMGGYGTFDALARRPDFFAAAVPICGGGDKKTASKIKHLPIWIFHGDADNVIPVSMSRAMVVALKKAGGKPKYTEYPGVRHSSWSATYANPKVWSWLFSQKK